MIDITADQQALILSLLNTRLPKTTAIAFGSRVDHWPFGRGSKPYSDLDIALFGLTPADALALAHLRADLEESALPWRVDISDASDLPSALQALVGQYGVALQDTPAAQDCQS
jgi:hypothetical protein